MGVVYFLLFGFPVLWLAKLCLHLLEILRLKWKTLSLGIPTFKGLPILGNSLELVKSVPGISPSVFTLEVVSGFRKALQEHDLYMFSIGPYSYVALTKPDVVEVLLSDNQNVNKSDDYHYLYPWLGTGLLTSDYGKWKKLRKLLTPAFHFRILDEFQPIISDYSDTMVKLLQAEVGKPFTCLEPFITNCALDIIAGTALGVNVGAQEATSSPFVLALQDVSCSVFKRIFKPWLWPELVFRLSPEGRRMTRSLKVVKAFIKEVIRKKKENLTENKEEVYKYFDSNSENKRIRRAFLEIMLMHNMIHEDDQFSEEDIEDEVNTFSFAGHDTTAAGINWTLYLLGLYPEIQDKVYAELEEIFGDDKKRSITVDDVKKMNYLERVIKESQRLYPSVPFIARKLNKDFTIMNFTIPKGVVMMVAVPVLHRDPTSFPNPEVFDPDRFLITNRHPFAYVPFSAGPRNCIGQRFAMFEMKTVIANVTRNFKLMSLDPRDKVLVCTELISRPGEPIRAIIQTRD